MYHKWQSCDVWFLRHRVQQAEFFVILDCFLPFHPSMDPENQNFEKIKKITCRYYHFTHVHHKWQSYDVWFLRYGAQQTEFFFFILDPFLPFYPTNNLKNKNFEKRKKAPGDTIILQLHTINDIHMMYGSSDMEHNGQNFFFILDSFLPFYPTNNPKNKNLEKRRKTPGDPIILHMCTINDNHMMYGSWDMERNRHNFLSF